MEYLVQFLKTCKAIDRIILAISEGVENKPFEALAGKMGVPFIIGPEQDVQQRLIMAAEHVRGDIIYRVTTECPFIYMDTFEQILDKHLRNRAALTVIEGLPEGAYYEIINLKDLKRAHDEGEERHRSELCTLYMCENPDRFFLQRLAVDQPALRRPDIRVTVDYPEDLIVVRELYRALKQPDRYITIEEIIDYLDKHPRLKEVNGWIDAGKGRIWD
ncbi:MAG TPA: hypothetical protein P5308_05285 [Syntrophales bacterium]|nr:hypothetical protein [Syntrophales bacterium]